MELSLPRRRGEYVFAVFVELGVVVVVMGIGEEEGVDSTCGEEGG